MSYLKINDINKNFGEVVACKDISLTSEKGEIVVICGESGSGKSTLLNIIAGFDISNTGSIKLNNRILFNDNTFIKPQKRSISLLFQNYSLFPNMTIEGNMKYAQKGNSNINKLLDLLKISDLKKRYPNQISGGQMQRAALARTLASDPDLILMDEPFSSLDNTTKDEVRVNFKEIIRELNKTAIIVSHDVQDAYSLADHVIIMKEGISIDSGKPQGIYTSPKSEYSAKLFGEINILTTQKIDLIQKVDILGSVLGIRPEHVKVENSGKWKCKGSTFKGNYYLSAFELNGVTIIASNRTKCNVNDNYDISFDENKFMKLK